VSAKRKDSFFTRSLNLGVCRFLFPAIVAVHRAAGLHVPPNFSVASIDFPGEFRRTGKFRRFEPQAKI
jgi:hypothetical protein